MLQNTTDTSLAVAYTSIKLAMCQVFIKSVAVSYIIVKHTSILFGYPKLSITLLASDNC